MTETGGTTQTKFYSKDVDLGGCFRNVTTGDTLKVHNTNFGFYRGTPAVNIATKFLPSYIERNRGYGRVTVPTRCTA